MKNFKSWLLNGFTSFLGCVVAPIVCVIKMTCHLIDCVVDSQKLTDLIAKLTTLENWLSQYEGKK